MRTYLENLQTNTEHTRSFYFENPIAIITANTAAELPAALKTLKKAHTDGFYCAGWVSYELGFLLDETLANHYRAGKAPLLTMGIYSSPINKPTKNRQPYYITKPRLEIAEKEYCKKIIAIQKELHRGNAYQINYTTRAKLNAYGDLFGLYQDLTKTQPVPYAAFIENEHDTIISLSPELYFTKQGDRLSVKPMKGTAAKDKPKDWLSQDEKNCSENLMIVDLLRNDLGKICIPGSVKTTKLFEVEEYRTLWQMTSTIEGRLLSSLDAFDTLLRLFPSGSVTGAPKLNAIKIIQKLEASPRGIYTGAIGVIEPNGDAIFNVAIRTLYAKKDKRQSQHTITYGVGSGIVYEANPKAEYQECLLKTKFLAELAENNSFGLIETMLILNKKIPLLSHHLRRLQLSAKQFKIPLVLSRLKKEIKHILNDHKATNTPHRLRLVVEASGKTTLHMQAITALPSDRIMLNPTPYQAGLFQQHKTTLREPYDQAFRQAQKLGLADIIFANEKGEITEGSIANIAIKKDGTFYTPPLSCGLLPGIQRQLFMKENTVIEKILYPQDLQTADELYIMNAVRGVMRVQLQQ